MAIPLLAAALGVQRGHQDQDITTLGQRAASSERGVWFPAAVELGRLAAGDASLRARIWDLAHVNTVGMKFVEIPPGQYTMGPSEEVPPIRRGISIDKAFYIGVTEITNAQYGALFPDFEPDPQYSPDSDSPAVNVDWKGAIEYCERLSEREGVIYRLPTEAEWEYACKAGAQTRFSFGSSPGKLSNYGWNDRALGRAQPVALLRPNPWGLYDMHGNVSEFAWRLPLVLSSQPTTRPVPATATRISDIPAGPVIRGGDWYSAVYACSCTARFPRPLFANAPFSSDPPWKKVVSFRVIREQPRNGEK